MFKKTMKKIYALLILAALSLNILPVMAESEDVYKLSVGAKVLCGLGLIESTADDIMLSNITRGDVAEYLYNIAVFGMEDTDDFNESLWRDEFFGELSQDLKEPKAQQKAEFGDVQENNAYYDAVAYATMTGLMSAEFDGSFNIDGEVSYIEAVKIIFDMLGYESVAKSNGGYPVGYKKLLARENIDIGREYNEPLTNDDFARLLYACFDVEIPTIKLVNGTYEITYDENKTLLSEKLGLNIAKGRVTDNGISSLLEKSTLGEGLVAIDGEVMQVSEGAEYICSMLGYRVACYYTNSKHDNAPSVVYAEKIKEEENITFDIEDFEEITKNSISYLTATRTKNVKLAQGYKMIVNSMAEDSFSEDCFDYDYGTVTLTKNQSGVFDLVIVEGYNSCYVMNVDKNENIIYNKLADDVGRNVIDLDDYEYVTIVNYEGTERTVSDIGVGNILDISENDGIIKIVLTENKREEITITGIDNEEREITDDENTYELSKSFVNGYASVTLLTGKTYTVYFNAAGQIVWAERGGNTGDWLGAYIVKVYENEETEAYCMKLYTEDGASGVYEFCDKVKLYDEDDNYSYGKAEAAFSSLKSYSGFSRIKLYDQKVREVELPLANAAAVKSDDRLFKTYSSSSHWTNGVSFNKDAFWNENSVVISVPNDKTDLNKYAISSVSIFRNTTTHAFDAYGTDPKSKVSKYFLTSSSQATTFTDYSPVMVVSKITLGCDDDGEVYYQISGLVSDGANITTVKVPRSENIMNNVGMPYRAASNTYDVESGDVIRYTLDTDGYVDYLEIIFDANAQNKLYPNAANGWLCGSDGKAPTDTTRIANPYTITHEGEMYYDQLGGYNQNQGMRIIYGWVENYRDGIITVTTQCPNGGLDKKLEESGYAYSESYVYNPASLVYVNYDGKTCVPVISTKSVIRDYEDYASQCSRILLLTNYGSVRAAVVMDGEMK